MKDRAGREPDRECGVQNTFTKDWPCAELSARAAAERNRTQGFSALGEIVSRFNKNVNWEAGMKFNICQNRDDIKALCGCLLTPQERAHGEGKERKGS